MGDGGVARPLLPLFLGGVAASLSGTLGPPALWAAGLLLGVALAKGRSWALFFGGALLVSVVATWHLARLPGDLPQLLERPQPLDVRGVVAGPPEPIRTGWRLPLRLEAVREEGEGWRPVRGKIALHVRVPGQDARPHEPRAIERLGFREGSRVEARVELQPLPSGGNPGLFSARDWYVRRGVAAGGWVPAPRLVRPVGRDEGVTAWARLRDRLALGLFEALRPELAGLGAALLLGDRRWLPEAVEDRFRAAGLGHLLAVSGMHVGILGGLAWWLVGGRRREAGWLARVAVSLWFLLLGLLTGGAPSARRAVLMALVALWAPPSRRDPAQALAAAGLILLLRDPLAAQDLGFQLSFAATAGILVLGPRMGRAGRRVAGP
ncbi:MAG TPA: ComEC family competence protein, partial [Limnochorda sp.]